MLETIGLTPTEAIRLLYRQIALLGEFPVELRVPNVDTARTLSMADKGEDAETFDSTEEIYAS